MTKPRMTKFWKSQLDEMLHLFQEARNDKVIAEVWDEAVDAFDRLLADAPNQSDERSIEYRERRDRLIGLLHDGPPGFTHIFGSHLSEWLEAWFRTELGYPVPETLATPLDHFGPDNPIEMQPDGDVRHMSEADMRHQQQIRDYYRSLEPASRPGRPRKDVAQAIRAYQLAQDGKPWLAIARDLFPSYDHYDPVQREKMREKIPRLVEGAALSPIGTTELGVPIPRLVGNSPDDK